jgi:hypothetical protein
VKRLAVAHFIVASAADGGRLTAAPPGRREEGRFSLFCEVPMSFNTWPTTQELLDVFTAEVTECGGRVINPYDDGIRLYARAVLPQVREVGPQDRVQGGVAMRAVEGEVRLHPYVYRQVCSNGAIAAQALATRRIVYADDWPSAEADEGVLPLLREAVRACCGREAFARSALDMRATRFSQADPDFQEGLLLQLFTLAGVTPEMVRDILSRFERERDRSRFAMMNAVTAAARDTRDPELRWGLEELGGGIPAVRPPARGTGGTTAKREAVAMAGAVR